MPHLAKLPVAVLAAAALLLTLSLPAQALTLVGNGRAALEHLAEAERLPDLILSDVMMPGGKNGIQLAREVRARHAGLPVVLASGYAESVRRDAEAQGLTLLAKPFDIATLAEAVKRAV